ncbi:hypothetical protein SAURM35S_04747 [Streptomyces aurantiogriseus]
MMSTARTAALRTGSGSRRRAAGSSTHNGRYAARSRSALPLAPLPSTAPTRPVPSGAPPTAPAAAGAPRPSVTPRPCAAISELRAAGALEALGSRSAVPRTAAPSSGAPRRSAVPINVSLPTAGRPLASGSKNRLPSGCPACALLRRPGAACGSCGRFRPQFPMSRTSNAPGRFPGLEKFWPTRPRRRSDPVRPRSLDSGRQSPAMPGQLPLPRRRYGWSASRRLFELTLRR